MDRRHVQMMVWGDLAAIVIDLCRWVGELDMKWIVLCRGERGRPTVQKDVDVVAAEDGGVC